MSVNTPMGSQRGGVGYLSQNGPSSHAISLALHIKAFVVVLPLFRVQIL